MPADSSRYHARDITTIKEWRYRIGLFAPPSAPSQDLNDCPEVSLIKGKSDAGDIIDSLRLRAQYPGDGGPTIAELSLAPGYAQKLVNFFHQTGAAGTASAAQMLKLAGKLRFAQSGIMGRFGRSAREIVYDFASTAGGS